MYRYQRLEKLATFDIEYLFLNIRAKSVGENVQVNTVLMMKKHKFLFLFS